MIQLRIFFRAQFDPRLKPWACLGGIVNGMLSHGPLRIKELVCNTATLGGDVIIDEMTCLGKCNIKGDGVKIGKRH